MLADSPVIKLLGVIGVGSSESDPGSIPTGRELIMSAMVKNANCSSEKLSTFSPITCLIDRLTVLMRLSLRPF